MGYRIGFTYFKTDHYNLGKCRQYYLCNTFILCYDLNKNRIGLYFVIAVLLAGGIEKIEDKKRFLW